MLYDDQYREMKQSELNEKRQMFHDSNAFLPCVELPTFTFSLIAITPSSTQGRVRGAFPWEFVSKLRKVREALLARVCTIGQQSVEKSTSKADLNEDWQNFINSASKMII